MALGDFLRRAAEGARQESGRRQLAADTRSKLIGFELVHARVFA
jgi:hypothetical protein